jgi:hypothetical protein
MHTYKFGLCVAKSRLYLLNDHLFYLSVTLLSEEIHSEWLPLFYSS